MQHKTQKSQGSIVNGIELASNDANNSSNLVGKRKGSEGAGNYFVGQFYKSANLDLSNSRNDVLPQRTQIEATISDDNNEDDSEYIGQHQQQMTIGQNSQDIDTNKF